MPSVAKCLLHESKPVQFKALQLAGNICLGPQKFVDRLLDTEVLVHVLGILKTYLTEDWIQECCLLFTNLACGESRNVQHLLQRGVITYLCIVLLSGQATAPVSL